MFSILCPIEIWMIYLFPTLSSLPFLSLSSCLCPQEICHTGPVSWWRCVLLTGGTGTEWKAMHTFHYPTHLVLYTYWVSLALLHVLHMSKYVHVHMSVCMYGMNSPIRMLRVCVCTSKGAYHAQYDWHVCTCIAWLTPYTYLICGPICLIMSLCGRYNCTAKWGQLKVYTSVQFTQWPLCHIVLS